MHTFQTEAKQRFKVLSCPRVLLVICSSYRTDFLINIFKENRDTSKVLIKKGARTE